MELSQLTLAKLWLYSFWLGGFCGILYDLFQILPFFKPSNTPPPWFGRVLNLQLKFLRAPKHKKCAFFHRALQIAFDVLFCLVCTVLMILLIYQMNNGKFRFAVLLYATTGFVCYRVTASRAVCCILTWILFILQAIVRYVVFFALLPLRALWRICRSLAVALYIKLKARALHRQRLRYTKKLPSQVACNARYLTFQPQTKNKGYKKKKEQIRGAKKAI